MTTDRYGARIACQLCSRRKTEIMFIPAGAMRWLPVKRFTVRMFPARQRSPRLFSALVGLVSCFDAYELSSRGVLPPVPLFFLKPMEAFAMFNKFLHTFQNRIAAPRHRGKPARRNSPARRLQMEFLEDRLTLSGMPVFVTSGADHGPGSLRDAIAAPIVDRPLSLPITSVP